MCVDVYMVANLILLCSLKLRKLLQENMGYLIHLFLSSLFFSSGHLSTHCFRYLGHLSIFSILSFFLNNFFFLQLKLFKRDIYNNLEHLSYQAYFCVYSQCRSRAFLGGWKHVFAHSQCRSCRYMWSVRDLDLESMINFSTRVIRFDQTQYNNK